MFSDDGSRTGTLVFAFDKLGRSNAARENERVEALGDVTASSKVNGADLRDKSQYAAPPKATKSGTAT